MHKTRLRFSLVMIYEFFQPSIISRFPGGGGNALKVLLAAWQPAAVNINVGRAKLSSPDQVGGVTGKEGGGFGKCPHYFRKYPSCYCKNNITC